MEVLSPQRKAVVETATILMRLYGDFTSAEVVWMSMLSEASVKGQFEKLRLMGVISVVRDGDQISSRVCRESGRLMPRWTIVEDAMVYVEDHAQATADAAARQATTNAGFSFDHEPGIPEPTKARPGSAEKIEVMARRYRSGLAAIHPGDAGYDGRPLDA